MINMHPFISRNSIGLCDLREYYLRLSFPQMIILSLIVKRARVKALVKDKRAALEAFGTYVEVDALLRN